LELENTNNWLRDFWRNNINPLPLRGRSNISPPNTARLIFAFIHTAVLFRNTLPIPGSSPPVTFDVPEDKQNIENKAF
jgi:hypothetical protein